MNNEQLKLKIELLSEQRKFFESFFLPILTGVVIAAVSKEFLGNIMYLCFAAIGVGLIIFLSRKVIKLNKQINSLINQIQ